MLLVPLIAVSWSALEALAAAGACVLAAISGGWALVERRRAKQMSQGQKLDAVVMAVVGKPASPDGTFPKVNGLVDDFREHRDEMKEHQERVDKQMAEFNERLDYVASQYTTNGGSTVKDDLLLLRSGMTNLSLKVSTVLDGQATAATIRAADHETK